MLHVKIQKKPQSIKSIISSIKTRLTEAVLNWPPSCFATAARRLLQYKIHILFPVVWSSISRSHPIFVLLLSEWFKSGDFVFIQVSAPCSAHRARATHGDL